MDMKKVLLIGSSYSSAPILTVLRKREFHISVCGAYEDDPCHEHADKSFYLDYSNAEALVALIAAEDFDYIVPSCNDFAYMSGVLAAARFDFPGFDTPNVAEILHTKHAFRQFTKAAGIPAPAWAMGGDSAALSLLQLPVLVKPVDAFSGRGVSKVCVREDLASAITTARNSSRSGDVVVEEFVDGKLHSHSAFVRNGKIVQDFFVDEFCSVYPYQVDSSNHPSLLSAFVRSAVRETMARIIGELGLCDGLLHTQFICDGETFWIIECMRRAPGDLYSNLIGYSTGAAYTEMYTQPFIGEEIVVRPLLPIPRNMARHTISVAEPRTFFSFSHSIPSSKVTVVPLKLSGHNCQEAPYDKIAILFAELASPDLMRDLVPVLREHVNIKTIEENCFD